MEHIHYYKATRRPDPPATPAREMSSAGRVHAWTLPEYVHQAILRQDRAPLLCECGAPATCIGAFAVITPAGTAISGGLLLCATCATQVDAGVKVRPLAEEA